MILWTANRSLPFFRLAVAMVLAAALMPLIGCGSDLATSDRGSDGTPGVTTAPPPATEPTATMVPPTSAPVANTPGEANCTNAVAAAPEASKTTALRLADEYANRSEQCPSPDVVQELLYIWQQNRDYWAEFPAQETRFFDSNVAASASGVRRELQGLLFDAARRMLADDPDFPMVMDSGPTVVDDLTVYEFSGGQTVLLVITRNDVVSRVYRFDVT